MQILQSIESLHFGRGVNVRQIGCHSKGVLDVEDVQLGHLGVNLQQQRQWLADTAGRSENSNANIVLCNNKLNKQCKIISTEHVYFPTDKNDLWTNNGILSSRFRIKKCRKTRRYSLWTIT